MRKIKEQTYRVSAKSRALASIRSISATRSYFAGNQGYRIEDVVKDEEYAIDPKRFLVEEYSILPYHIKNFSSRVDVSMRKLTQIGFDILVYPDMLDEYVVLNLADLERFFRFQRHVDGRMDGTILISPNIEVLRTNSVSTVLLEQTDFQGDVPAEEAYKKWKAWESGRSNKQPDLYLDSKQGRLMEIPRKEGLRDFPRLFDFLKHRVSDLEIDYMICCTPERLPPWEELLRLSDLGT